MRIVQISDLHCSSGESFLKDKLQLAVNEINALNPDIVAITGDLTENGFKNEFEEAKRFIDQIMAPKVITAGNHDVRYTGHLIFQELFGSPSSFIINDECAIFCANTARPDKNEGRIGVDQMGSLLEKLSNPKDKIKVVVMHHHPIPVPDTGLEQAIIEDAGDCLKGFSSVGVDLVLCGHRHRPWIWQLCDMSFVFSGAVSTRKLRGFFENSYNIIDIKENEIDAKLKIVGNGLVDFKEIIFGRPFSNGVAPPSL
ncbi:MAG: metallophosphoesterase [Candidatus Bathyarchaeia archaeon]